MSTPDAGMARLRRQAEPPPIAPVDDSLPDLPEYDDGQWHADTPSAIATPAAPASIGSASMVRPVAPTSASAAFSATPVPSSASIARSSMSASSSLPSPRSTDTPDAQKEQDGSDDDSGFKVAYLTPVFVLIGVFLICSLGGRLWGKMWHARKREARRRDRHAQRLASDLGTESNHPGSWDGRPLSLHDKESALDDIGYDSDDDDEKYPGTFHVLSQRILGDKGRVVPPTTRSRTGKHEGKVQSNSWLAVQVRRMVSPEGSQLDVDRYTSVHQPLRQAASRDRLRQMRGDLEAAPENGSLLGPDRGPAAERQAGPSMWSKLVGRWAAERSSPGDVEPIKGRGLGLSFNDPGESEKLWGRPALQSSPSSLSRFHGQSDGGGGMTMLPQPKFASSDVSFSRHPSTLSANNLRSRSRGYYKPLPEIVDLPTPVVEPRGPGMGAGSSGAPQHAFNSQEGYDDLQLDSVVVLDRNLSQAHSEGTYSAAGTTVSADSQPESRAGSQGPAAALNRSKTKRRPGTTYMYDEQLPSEEHYHKTPSPPMETPRKWRPHAASMSSPVGREGSLRDGGSVLTPPAKVARTATMSSKSEMLLSRVQTQQRSTTDYIASTRPLDRPLTQEGREEADAAAHGAIQHQASPPVRPTPTRASPRKSVSKRATGEAEAEAAAAAAVAAAAVTAAEVAEDAPKRSRPSAPEQMEEVPKPVSRSKTVSRAKSTRTKLDDRRAAADATSPGQLTAKELTDLLNTPGLSPEAHASTLADLLALYEDESDVPDTPDLARGDPLHARSRAVGEGASSDEESLATDTEATGRPPAASAREAAAAARGAGKPQRSGTVRTVGLSESVADKSAFYTPLPGIDDGEAFVPTYMQMDEPGSLDHVFDVLSRYVGVDPGTPEVMPERRDGRGDRQTMQEQREQQHYGQAAEPTTPKWAGAARQPDTPLSRKKTWAKGEDGRWYRADEEEGGSIAASSPGTPYRRFATDSSATTPSRAAAAPRGPGSTVSSTVLASSTASQQDHLPSSLTVASPNPLDRIASPPPTMRHDLFFASPASPTSVVTRPRTQLPQHGGNASPVRRARDQADAGSAIASSSSTVMPSFGSVVGVAAPVSPASRVYAQEQQERPAHRTNTKTRRWVSEQASPPSVPSAWSPIDQHGHGRGMHSSTESESGSGSGGGAGSGSPQRRSALVKRARPPRRYQATLSGGPKSSPFEGAAGTTSPSPSSGGEGTPSAAGMAERQDRTRSPGAAAAAAAATVVQTPLEKERQRQEALDRVRSIVNRGYLSKSGSSVDDGASSLS
ncbi:uncharacterized protein PFL1_00684 [Pseudozyma flocculosa PF-1]|uniref:Uncharacterized protein n=1 Tax=Pseudozyma flocculosa TaxID=84751 RepID=A0A5C3F2X3_9BASI|nr:uncharacterized protein PFL1_00684 [Pseudozyma flocculosa PF-1]EPQ31349.1 hypothetical protein PFL1_00684 [Pseudozyma flocculosa PF-1]SPO38873.1 uncharacterized protein PSFLO_04352 [Pseudozyma flocculosa]